LLKKHKTMSVWINDGSLAKLTKLLHCLVE